MLVVVRPLPNEIVPETFELPDKFWNTNVDEPETETPEERGKISSNAAVRLA